MGGRVNTDILVLSRFWMYLFNVSFEVQNKTGLSLGLATRL